MNLKSILKRSTSKITADRAKRLERAGLTASNTYVQKLNEELDVIIDEIDDTMDISASTNRNQGLTKLTGEKMKAIVITLHELHNKKYLLEQRIKVAENVNLELKGDE